MQCCHNFVGESTKTAPAADRYACLAKAERNHKMHLKPVWTKSGEPAKASVSKGTDQTDRLREESLSYMMPIRKSHPPPKWNKTHLNCCTFPGGSTRPHKPILKRSSQHQTPLQRPSLQQKPSKTLARNSKELGRHSKRSSGET